MPPGQSDTLTVFLEPRYDRPASGDLAISHYLGQVSIIPIENDIRELTFETELLRQEPAIPLGEAATVIVTPDPFVNIERGTLFFRPGGSTGGFANSIDLTPSKSGFVAIIPGELVTEGGLEYYVQVENSGIFALDPWRAPSLFHYQEVESPVSLTAVPIPNSGSSYIEGLDINIQVLLQNGSQFQEGNLFYRRGGEESYTSSTLAYSDTAMIATIPGSTAGPRGLEYWVGVQTLTTALTEPAHEPERNPHQIRITIPDLIEEHPFAGEKYRLLSIPLAMEGTITGALTDDIGGPDNTRWRMFAYAADAGSYSEIPNETLFAFEMWRAYWLITKDAHRIDSGPDRGISTPTAEPFRIALDPGYNLVGCPFPYPVAWDSCLVDTLAVSRS